MLHSRNQMKQAYKSCSKRAAFPWFAPERLCHPLRTERSTFLHLKLSSVSGLGMLCGSRSRDIHNFSFQVDHELVQWVSDFLNY